MPGLIFEEPKPLDDVVIASHEAITEAIVAELMDQFFDSRRCGIEIPVWQARLIAFGALKRLLSPPSPPGAYIKSDALKALDIL